MSKLPQRIVVVGVGNLLMTDEGVGIHILERLQQDYILPPEVEGIDGGTAGLLLPGLVARADFLLILDAVALPKPPGSVVRLTGEALAARFQIKLSPHQLGVADLLTTLVLLGEEPGEVVVIGVVPDRIEMGLALSLVVAAAVPEAVAAVAAELARIGVILPQAERGA